MQWRVTHVEVLDTFHSKSGSPRPITNSSTDSCVPFSHPFTHSSWRLSARHHAHSDQQQLRRRAFLPRTGASQNVMQNLRNALPATLKSAVGVLTYRITAGDHSSSARQGGSGACAVLPRHTSCGEGSVCLRSICPAVTRSGSFARDVLNRSNGSYVRERGFVWAPLSHGHAYGHWFEASRTPGRKRRKCILTNRFPLFGSEPTYCFIRFPFSLSWSE